MNEVDRARGIRIGWTVQSPGWNDVLKLFDDLVKEQVNAVNAFSGWDRDQKCDLMTRQQATMQMRDEFLRRINNYLLAGSAPSDNNTLEDANLADELRSKVLNETRVPGTYEV